MADLGRQCMKKGGECYGWRRGEIRDAWGLQWRIQGGQGGHAPPPLACKNRPKKDGRRARRLIFHVSWPPLSEVSGSATGLWGEAGLLKIIVTCNIAKFLLVSLKF